MKVVGVVWLATLTSDRLTMTMMDLKTNMNLVMTDIADSAYNEGACGEMAMDEDVFSRMRSRRVLV